MSQGILTCTHCRLSLIAPEGHKESTFNYHERHSGGSKCEKLGNLDGDLTCDVEVRIREREEEAAAKKAAEEKALQEAQEAEEKALREAQEAQEEEEEKAKADATEAAAEPEKAAKAAAETAMRRDEL